jgi:hypothetical protein
MDYVSFLYVKGSENNKKRRNKILSNSYFVIRYYNEKE